MRRRRPIRLLICLPLIAVMGLWAYSLAPQNSWHFYAIRPVRLEILSIDGSIFVTISNHMARIPYWAMWIAVAIGTIIAQSRFRTPPEQGKIRIRK